MGIFFYYKYGALSSFFSTGGLVENFDDASFYNSMYVAISELSEFCEKHSDEYSVEDFEVYMKGTVY